MYSLLDRFQGSEVFSVVLPDEPIKTRDWVRLSEVCRVLGFKNGKEAVETHCKDWQYREFKVGAGRPALYVTFSGLMRLCLKSKSPVAVEFQDWLTEELLPKLYADGYVTLKSITTRQLTEMFVKEFCDPAKIAELKEYLKVIVNNEQDQIDAIELSIDQMRKNYAAQNPRGKLIKEDYPVIERAFHEKMADYFTYRSQQTYISFLQVLINAAEKSYLLRKESGLSHAVRALHPEYSSAKSRVMLKGDLQNIRKQLHDLDA